MPACKNIHNCGKILYKMSIVKMHKNFQQMSKMDLCHFAQKFLTIVESFIQIAECQNIQKFSTFLCKYTKIHFQQMLKDSMQYAQKRERRSLTKISHNYHITITILSHCHGTISGGGAVSIG